MPFEHMTIVPTLEDAIQMIQPCNPKAVLVTDHDIDEVDINVLQVHCQLDCHQETSFKAASIIVIELDRIMPEFPEDYQIQDTLCDTLAESDCEYLNIGACATIRVLFLEALKQHKQVILVGIEDHTAHLAPYCVLDLEEARIVSQWVALYEWLAIEELDENMELYVRKTLAEDEEFRVAGYQAIQQFEQSNKSMIENVLRQFTLNICIPGARVQSYEAERMPATIASIVIAWDLYLEGFRC